MWATLSLCGRGCGPAGWVADLYPFTRPCRGGVGKAHLRVTTGFKRLLCRTGITVSGVEFGKSTVVVTVKLTARKLQCPLCVFTTRAQYDRSPVSSVWRNLDLVGWLATTMDKTALRRLMRIDRDTTGRIIERVIETGLDPRRLDDLFVIGVDEVSWRKGHSFLTMVSNNVAVAALMMAQSFGGGSVLANEAR